ncbi:hypothetical protein SBV1_2780014 [Verrucomicrobia bacterium]|nr:hypothetical protein SBV1_2780014 [Verrucomicrobiota bacterium]
MSIFHLKTARRETRGYGGSVGFSKHALRVYAIDFARAFGCPVGTRLYEKDALERGFGVAPLRAVAGPGRG